MNDSTFNIECEDNSSNVLSLISNNTEAYLHLSSCNIKNSTYICSKYDNKLNTIIGHQINNLKTDIITINNDDIYIHGNLHCIKNMNIDSSNILNIIQQLQIDVNNLNIRMNAYDTCGD
jgi:hypothetical protein